MNIHRLLLKQGLKPVLDLTEEKSKEDVIYENKSKEDIAGIPFIFVSDQELANKTANEYFSFRVYNEKGIPSEFTARGIKETNPLDPSEIKYRYTILGGHGDVIIDKSTPDKLSVQGLENNRSEKDLQKGKLDLYFSDSAKRAAEEMQKNIETLKLIYSQSSVSVGDSWTEQDDKLFDMGLFGIAKR